MSQFIDWHILYIQSKRIPCSWKRTVILDLHKVLVNDEAGKLTVSVNYRKLLDLVLTSIPYLP